MKMKRQIYSAVIGVLFFCCIMAEGAQIKDIDQIQLQWFGVSTLRNVQVVYPLVSLEIVEINAPEPNFTSQIGPLTQKDLQSFVEQMLQKSRIKITNKFNAIAANAPLSLNVTVFAKVRDDTPIPSYAVFVYTEAMQPVALLRDTKIHTFSRTWPMVPTGAGTRNLLLVTPETIFKEVTDEVTRQVTNFIIDFSAANPAMRIIVPQPPQPQQEQPQEEQPQIEQQAPVPPSPVAIQEESAPIQAISRVVINVQVREGFC
jgi:hypothetical protein